MNNSLKDLWLVALALLQIVLLVLVFSGELSLGQNVVVAVASVLLIGTNYQCVSHNFLHLPFFRSKLLNDGFSIMNSICLGLPQSLYREHHLNHHRYNNDPEKDESSLYKFGTEGKEEGVLRYSFLGVFRTSLGVLFSRALKQNRRLVLLELAALLIVFSLMLQLNPLLFLGWYLPVWYLGQVFALLENYGEHHGAALNDRKRDSVSCYNPVYNFLWFNNGYHQEHHYRPLVHWTQVPTVTAELPEDRKVVPYCHLANLLN